jgi:small subunit ribosomal protein S8
MPTTDPIADYLTRLRNAIQARHKRVDIPASRLKREITRILVEQGFIAGVTEVQESPQRMLRLQLRYTDGRPAITGLRRISKPGRRIYVSCDDVPRVLNGLGIAVISTSRGVLTDRQARELRVGGEVLCYVW